MVVLRYLLQPEELRLKRINHAIPVERGRVPEPYRTDGVTRM